MKLSKLRCRRSALSVALSAGALFCTLIAPTAVQARPGFIGGGAHFNIGGHFGGMGRLGGFGGPGMHPIGPRPLPERRLEPDRRIVPDRRFGPDRRYPYGPHYWPGGYWPGNYWAGVAAGAAVGSFVYALPPACTTVAVGGVTFERCDGNWYRPTYSGSQIVYEVVAPPG